MSSRKAQQMARLFKAGQLREFRSCVNTASLVFDRHKEVVVLTHSAGDPVLLLEYIVSNIRKEKYNWWCLKDMKVYLLSDLFLAKNTRLVADAPAPAAPAVGAC